MQDRLSGKEGELGKAGGSANVMSKPWCQGRIGVSFGMNEREKRCQRWPQSTSLRKYQPGIVVGGEYSTGLMARWGLKLQISKQLTKEKGQPFKNFS